MLTTLGMAGVMALPSPAHADEGEPDVHEVEITDTALYASPVTDAIPDTLTSEVPPTALCVLEPALCPEESDDARDLLRSTVTTVIDEVPSEPLHPVPPDSIAVSFLGGNPRYQSALVVDVPAPPPGQEFQRVELVLPQSQPSYHLDSPAFRHVVLGTFAAIGDSDPELAVEGITEALIEEDLVSREQLLGIEVCPLTVGFEPQGAPQAYSAEELPREAPEDEDADEDELGEVAVECFLGGDGIYDEDDEVWRFDITFAAQAWADGDLDNLGLLFSPTGAPNLAFGDPDTSTNAQVVMDITEASLVLETFDASPPEPPAEGPGSEGPPPSGGDGMGEDAPGGGTGGSAPPPSGGSTGSSGGGGAPPPSGGGGGGGAPGGSDGGAVPGGDEPLADDGAATTAGAGEDTQAIAATEETGIQRPWWMWLLVPVILGGAYLTHFSLLGSGSAARSPRGALARLTPAGRASRA